MRTRHMHYRKYRRDFLRRIALTGGALALAPYAGSSLAADPPAAPAPPGRGYRETAHVRKYYSKARI